MGTVLGDIVEEAGRRFAEVPVFVANDGWELTYGDFARAVDEVARGLAARGLGPGRVLGLVLPSRPEYAVLYAAAARLGAITAGVNPRLAPAERAALIELADPELTVVMDDLDEGLTAERRCHRAAPAHDAARLLTGLRAPDGPPPPELPDDPSRAVAIVFTSGTTGLPRGAVFTDRQLEAMIRIDVGMKWGEGGHIIASTQFAHVGFMTKFPAQLRMGTTIHWLERWRADDVLRITSELGLQAIGGVAPQIALMLASPHFDEYDLSAVDTVLAGGGPSPPALVEEARRRFGADYLIRYSCTQSGGVGTTTSPGAPLEEALHTVGRPRPGIEVSVRADDGRELPHGEVGTVCLRSDTVMEGYWRDPEATTRDLRGGWLHTGDLGELDDQGRLRIVGRSSDVYIRGGYNVHPGPVEAVLAEHPAVRDVAVVARPDPVMGEIGVAVVVPSDPGHPPDLEALRHHAAPHLARFKLPEALRIVDALPLTSMQKIDRRALARHEAEPPGDRPRAPGSQPPGRTETDGEVPGAVEQ